MSWASSWVFILVPLLFVFAAYKLWNRKEQVATLKLSTIRALKMANSGIRAKLSEVPFLFKIVALVFVIAALARPQEASTKIKKDVEGIDIVIALDISDSMLIEDMKPENRLEASKLYISEFIKARTSDRIGLVVFSGESFTRVPLTLDYKMLLENIQQIETTRTIKMGTAIGVALANAAGRLRDSTAKSRIIVFMTDGENNSGTIDPDTALEIAKGYKIKIYSIGMGVDGEAKLPQKVQDPLTGKVVKVYRPMHSKINEELLTKFATQTGGKFWRASTGNALQKVFTEIDQLEKTKISVDKFTRYDEKYQNYLFWALSFYILSFLSSGTILRRLP